MALWTKDNLYYREIKSHQIVSIGSDRAWQVMFPGIEKKIDIIWKTDHAEITVINNTTTERKKIYSSDERQVITAKLGEITVIDNKNQIAVLFAPVSQSNKHIYFDNNDRIRVGRTEKQTEDGSANTVIIKLPFVSSRHLEFISQNGKLFVSDNCSKNGTFVNGQRVTQQELHPCDVISILTFRMIYNGNSLSFFNSENMLSIKQSRKESKKEGKKKHPLVRNADYPWFERHEFIGTELRKKPYRE